MRPGLEAFAAARRTRQDQAIEDLTPKVAAALDNYAQEDWWRPLLAEVRGLFNDVLAEDSGGDVRRDVRAWASLSADIAATLPKTTKPDEHTAATIATWLATATINSAAMSAATHDSEPLVMEWVTMHDSHVREAHRDTDGQQRPPGEKFDVDGVAMAYPGDPTAPIELWINCRCALAPVALSTNTVQSLNAAADGGDGIVIVALPVASDAVHDLAMTDAHMTLVWLGGMGENPDLDIEEISSAIKTMAEPLEPFSAPVTGIEPLGDASAVWMLDPDSPATDVRSALTQHPAIGAAWAAVKQWPVFTPHVSIGYGDVPLSGDGIEELSGVKQITFDRLALWNGDDRQEYPLSEESDMTDTAEVEAALADDTVTDEPEVTYGALPWYGVLAPEGVWSGDGRMFAADSLTHRDLPLPLTWQKVTGEGHDGSVTVAKIENIWRQNGLMLGEGHFVDTPETDEAVGLLAEFGKYGVSVDADDAEFEFAEDESDNAHGGKITFTKARIASASMVGIPAFAEAFIAIGTWAENDPSMLPATAPVSDGGDVCNPDDPAYDEEACAAKQAAAAELAASAEEFVSDKPWSNFTQADYTDEQWYAACVLHKNGESRAKSDNGLPIKEPGGALNRNGVHAAAARFNQVQAPAAAKAAAKAKLRGAYKQLGEEPPDVIKAAAQIVYFGRGPGWITNPEDTRRIHDYWTKPGEEGYAKVNWGHDGDFARCKALVGEKIAANSPEDVRFLNQICSQWHHDATGFWPGHAPAETGRNSLEPDGEPAPAVSLVAAATRDLRPPAAWFVDPGFDRVTPLTVTEEGRVFGHIAAWGTCHVGYSGVCTEPPHSETDYAYFKVGQTLTDEGPINTGTLTIGGGHASGRLGVRPALAHYDDVGTGWASVNCGEDEHGIWVAGWVKPGTPEETVVLARSVAPSGDWREVAGNLEMIACHQVNSPGFGIPRPQVTVQDGMQVALVAAGVVEPVQSLNESAFDPDEFAEKVAAAIESRAARRATMAALRERVTSKGV